MNNNFIDKEAYNYYISRIRSIGYEKVLEKIQEKKLETKYETIGDCGIYFIKNLLNSDWGRTIVVTFDKYEMEFITSKYLSNYFKKSIKELLSDKTENDIIDILNSDKHINEMDEKEIKILYDLVVEYYRNNKSPKDSISSSFLTYLYKLNGKGVTSFIKNNIDSEEIARHILLTSGLNDRASYYSGRGVMYCDLNEKNLIEIFNKLLNLDYEYALSFINMVCDMNTLGATEFINEFIRLGINKFKYNKKNEEENNISLEGNSNLRDAIALATICSSMNKRDNNYQITASESMKESFLLNIRENLTNREFHLDEEQTNKLTNLTYKKVRSWRNSL